MNGTIVNSSNKNNGDKLDRVLKNYFCEPLEEKKWRYGPRKVAFRAIRTSFSTRQATVSTWADFLAASRIGEAERPQRPITSPSPFHTLAGSDGKHAKTKLLERQPQAALNLAASVTHGLPLPCQRMMRVLRSRSQSSTG